MTMSFFSRFHEKSSGTSINATPASKDGLRMWDEQPRQTSQWPRILNSCLQISILVATIPIIGLLSHTLRSYSGSRNIRFGTGASISWPEDLNLIPAYTFLALAAATVPVASISAIHQGWLFKQKYHTFSIGEGASALSACILFVLWLVTDGIQAKSEGDPKKDLLKWACKRDSSPTNVLVSYDSICREQVSHPK